MNEETELPAERIEVIDGDDLELMKLVILAHLAKVESIYGGSQRVKPVGIYLGDHQVWFTSTCEPFIGMWTNRALYDV